MIRRTPFYVEEPSTIARQGLSRIEVLILAAILAVLLSLAAPGLLMRRESSRKQQCVQNLRQLVGALQQYHDAHQVLPPAAIWKPGSLHSLRLDMNQRIDLYTFGNWVSFVLPYIGETELFTKFDSERPIADPVNEAVRMARLAVLTCPSDQYNSTSNPYQFEPLPDISRPTYFARGNYAVNAGTHYHRPRPGKASKPHGDGYELILNEDERKVRFIGSGIAAINHSFSLNDFVNGSSTLVAVEEIRAGIHPVDPRGVWSLGQIGGSITWGHGVTGDDGGPNNQGERSDDILGCQRLHQILGKSRLMKEKMPCVNYVNWNDQATARSVHTAGVNVGFLDGSVRFIDDRVDQGLWHVMHSRETPADILRNEFVAKLSQFQPPPDKAGSTTSGFDDVTMVAENSIGMRFVLIPAGEFQMGTPDKDSDREPLPADSPTHLVHITKAFWLGRDEVTQGDFEGVMGFNPSHEVRTPQATFSASRLPVEQVTWDEAFQFCQRLSSLPDERAAKRKYRLPTEAEWEYACRSGKSDAYCHPSKEHANLTGDMGGLSHIFPIMPVGSFAPNKFNVHDLRGNVWEWCADWYDRNYYSRSPTDDPQGPATGYLKTLRGNDWIYCGEGCRISTMMMVPWKSSPYVGFRVVCEKTP